MIESLREATRIAKEASGARFRRFVEIVAIERGLMVSGTTMIDGERYSASHLVDWVDLENRPGLAVIGTETVIRQLKAREESEASHAG